jgi:cell division protein FtsQ
MLARKQKRLLRPALLVVPMLGLVAFGFLAVRGGVEQSGLGSWIRHRVGLALPIEHIVVEGQRLTTDHDVEEALGLSPGDPIMGFSIGDAERDVEALPFVATATVQRRLPGTVLVMLVERTPFAVWQNQGRFVLIDRTGKVVENQGLNGKDAEAFAKLPLVVGEGAPPAAETLVDALDATPSVKSHVVAMVRVGQRRWNLTLRNGCDVLLPEAEEVPALKRLAVFEQDHKLLERPLLTIDMRLPDRLLIRERPVGPPVPDGADGKPVTPAPGPATTGDDASRRPA